MPCRDAGSAGGGQSIQLNGAESANNDQDGALAAVEDDDQRPVPSAWRPVIQEIVDAFARHDYQLGAGIAGVAPVAANTAMQIAGYIGRYG